MLAIIRDAALGKHEIAQGLGKAKPTRYLHDLIRKLLASHLLEPTLPEKPNSRLQKYRLTARGRQRLAALPKKTAPKNAGAGKPQPPPPPAATATPAKTAPGRLTTRKRAPRA